jgi:hypothetical protein
MYSLSLWINYTIKIFVIYFSNYLRNVEKYFIGSGKINILLKSLIQEIPPIFDIIKMAILVVTRYYILIWLVVIYSPKT